MEAKNTNYCGNPACKRKMGFLYFLGFNKWYQCQECHKVICYECINNCKRTDCHSKVCNECLKHLHGEILLVEEILLSWKIKKGNSNPINLCPNCYNELNPLFLKYQQALDIENKVETFPYTYKGKINLIPNSVKEKINTEYSKDKDKLKRILRVSAAYLDCNLIYDIKENKKSIGQTYIENFFSLEGIPANRKYGIQPK